MKESVKDLCDLFMENKRSIGKSFKWENGQVPFIAAAQLASKGKNADIAKLKECEKIIKKNTGALSEFRGIAKLPMTVKMADMDYPEEFLAKAQKADKDLKKDILSSVYRLLTAISLAEFADDSEYDEILKRTRRIYKDMKECHRFLTGAEDMPDAALLALTGRPAEQISDEMEACFDILKKKFGRSNGTQSVSQILAISTKDTAEKCRRLIEIHDALKEEKCRISKSDKSFAILACLAISDMSVAEIVSEVKEADEYIKSSRGFGSWSFDVTQRRMVAALLVLVACGGDNAADSKVASAVVSNAVSTAVASSIALIVAQESAMCCIIACSTVAISSNH